MPLITSSTTSAIGHQPPPLAPDRPREHGAAPTDPVDGERSVALDRCGSRRSRSAMTRDPVAPRQPAHDLAEQVRAGAPALGVRPVPVGEHEDVQRALGVAPAGPEGASRRTSCSDLRSTPEPTRPPLHGHRPRALLSHTLADGRDPTKKATALMVRPDGPAACSSQRWPRPRRAAAAAGAAAQPPGAPPPSPWARWCGACATRCDSGRVSTAQAALDQIARRATGGAAAVKFGVSSFTPRARTWPRSCSSTRRRRRAGRPRPTTARSTSCRVTAC